MLAFGFASFLAFGFVLVMVGANQAHLERELDLTLAQSGLMTACVSLGLGVGVVAAGPLFDRLPRRPLFLGSMLLAGASLVGVGERMAFERWLVHLTLAGFGIGFYDALLNGAVVQRFAERSAKPMMALHAAATLGAISGPLVADLLGGRGSWIASFHGAGVAHLALAGACLFVDFPAPDERLPDQAGLSSALSPALLPFALIAFAYVGVETAMTVFAVPYATQLGVAERGAASISLFWLGLLAGRIGVLGLRTVLDARVLSAAGVAGAAVLLLGTLARPGPVEATFLAAGAALGCVYPLMISLAGQAFPHARGTAAGLAAGAGALGGFAIPWLTGAIGDASGAATAVTSLAFWSLAVGGLALTARRTRPPARRDVPPQ